ncbi:serine hydrolase family protein [Candidatus Peregrinibacteria bacterium]|nr:serine hydrolase family protein [Candidatus Peregrinibacteria bacterium]
MRNIFFIHGVNGNSRENWFPWLKEKLEAEGNRIFIPQFPTPKGQTLKNWLKAFEPYEKYLNENSIVIGHSLGVTFLLNILEKHKVRAAFFVAGFTGHLGKQFDDGIKTFAQRKFNWDAIRSNAKHYVIFHSDNDPYVKLKKAEELAKNLGIKICLIKNAGHFNEASGYTRFEKLFKKIKYGYL